MAGKNLLIFLILSVIESLSKGVGALEAIMSSFEYPLIADWRVFIALFSLACYTAS